MNNEESSNAKPKLTTNTNTNAMTATMKMKMTTLLPSQSQRQSQQVQPELIVTQQQQQLTSPNINDNTSTSTSTNTTSAELFPQEHDDDDDDDGVTDNDLSNSNLTRLKLDHRCSPTLLKNFLLQMKPLKRLKELDVNCCCKLFESPPESSSIISKSSTSTSISLFLAWMTLEGGKLLPTLESLEFFGLEKNETILLFNCLRNQQQKSSFLRKNLKRIYLSNCQIDNNLITMFILEILPLYPNLILIDLGDNNIGSVKGIVDNILSSSSSSSNVVSKSQLCRFKIYNNPIVNNIRFGRPTEKAAIISFLQIFNTVHDLGVLLYDESIYDYQRRNHPSSLQNK